MASTDLSEAVFDELCLRGIDTEQDVKDFRSSSRDSVNVIEDMSGVLFDVGNRKGRGYISRKRLRHDTLRLFNEGRLGNCFPIPGGCVFPGLPVTTELVAHFDAQDASSLNLGIPVNDGDDVTQWDDISGGGFNATSTMPAQVVTSTLPPIFRASVINGFPALSGKIALPDTQRVLTLGNIPGFEEQEEFTFFVVSRTPSFQLTPDNDTLYGQQWIQGTPAFPDGAGFKFASSPSGAFIDMHSSLGINDVARIIPGEPATGIDTNSVNAFVKNGLIVKKFTNGLEQNLTFQGSPVPQLVEYSTTATHTPLTVILGEHVSVSSISTAMIGAVGFVGEIIVYSVPLSDAQINLVNQYLMCKWGFV